MATDDDDAPMAMALPGGALAALLSGALGRGGDREARTKHYEDILKTDPIDEGKTKAFSDLFCDEKFRRTIASYLAQALGNAGLLTTGQGYGGQLVILDLLRDVSEGQLSKIVLDSNQELEARKKMAGEALKCTGDPATCGRENCCRREPVAASPARETDKDGTADRPATPGSRLN